MTPVKALILSSLTAYLLAACSFSDSSKSSSDSSGSVSDMASSPISSSSDSSRTDQEKFEDSVADYTAEFVVGSSGSLDTFRAHVGELADKYGISNWEADRHSYLGIGRGLKKADLGKPQISAFTESLSGKDPMKQQAIEDGLKK